MKIFHQHLFHYIWRCYFHILDIANAIKIILNAEEEKVDYNSLIWEIPQKIKRRKC